MPVKRQTYPPARLNSLPHIIVDISYRKDYILCRCEWRGPVEEYNAHRLAGNRNHRSR